MIKKFHKFFEALNFSDSDELEMVKNKHKIPDEVISDYFTELLDEGAEFKSVCHFIGEIKGGIKLYYNIQVSKNIKNPYNFQNHKVSEKNYLNFIEEQVSFIKQFNECTDRFKYGEDVEVNFNNIIEVPFWGAGNNSKESSNLSQIIQVTQEIKTDDYRLAREEFNKKDNPARKAVEDVIKKLEKNGIKEARELIESQENDEIIFIGFTTDDEIIVVATWSEEYGLNYDEGEISNAINAYEDGYCDEILGK
jgi:hypothetical protein